MINRIKEIARFFGLSSTAFADLVVIPRPVISHIFSERNRPSLEVIQKIGIAFPEIRLEWLLYGTGEMLLKQPGNPEPLVVSKPEIEEAEFLPEPEIKRVEVRENANSEPEAVPEESVVKPGKRTIKIVFIYDNGTFEEFLP